ncbi:MAG TPA: protein-L-isoaspartate(D-aspartate) O-methyltransferase [bacterium]|nr:protein-L-isoaspartate(D-aspartate) O-methyltransferase [bacterium]
MMIRLLLALALSGQAGCSFAPDTFELKRERMVKQHIFSRGIADPRIQEAFLSVPRHAFVAERYRDRAYEDLRVPFGFGYILDRPHVDAIILKYLAVKEGDKILEIGTGSGYGAALVAQIAGEVYTIDISKEISDAAAERLGNLGYENIFLKVGDGYLGWPEFAPFDAIFLRCSPHRIPAPLVEQLAEGGKLMIPLGGYERFQELILYTKSNGKLAEARRVAPADFFVMKGIIHK